MVASFLKQADDKPVLSLRVPRSHIEQLEALAAEMGSDRSGVARQAIEQFLAANSKKEPQAS